MAGHMTIISDGEKCYCGKKGCLESIVSATGIVNAAKRMNWQQKYPELPLTAETIFKESEQGNLVAQSIIDATIYYLKIGIQNYINLFAPDRIVLGGGVAQGLKKYLHFLQENSFLGPFKTYQTSVELSALEEHAGILGSAALFISPPNPLK